MNTCMLNARARSSMERSLTDEEINAIQDKVRQQVADVLKVELR